MLAPELPELRYPEYTFFTHQPYLAGWLKEVFEDYTVGYIGDDGELTYHIYVRPDTKGSYKGHAAFCLNESDPVSAQEAYQQILMWVHDNWRGQPAKRAARGASEFLHQLKTSNKYL